MTEQLERDLAALFHSVGDQLDVLPTRTHRSGMTRLNTALAAVVTLALVGGVALVGVRLSGSSGSSGVTLAGGEAKAQLLDAFRKTFSQPFRLTVSIGDQSQDQSQLQTQLQTQTDVDYAAGEAITRTRGAVTFLAVAGHTYRHIAPGEQIAEGLPAKTEWIEQNFPDSMNPAIPVASMQGISSFLGTDSAHMTANNGLLAGFTVVRQAGGRYAVKGSPEVTVKDFNPPDETSVFTVGSNGTVTSGFSRIIEHMHSYATGKAVTQTITASLEIQPLTAPLHLAKPDPATVVSQEQWLADMRKAQQTQMGNEVCHTNAPTPSANASHFSSGSIICTLVGGASITHRQAVASPEPSHN
jgi:hypothetical protein